jgi:hypothetical protein
MMHIHHNCPRLLCLLPVLFCAPLSSADELFPDKALESAVRKEVFAKRYNDEPLTKEDVKDISQVHGKGLGIKNLQGLEHCVAVQEIDLEDNQIEDIGPLADLKLLQSINLAGNKIQSVEALKELERVQYLELSRNEIEDISPLAKMTNMRSLYLSENKIKKIGVIKNFPKAWTLYLAKNPVRSFKPIGKMEWLSSLDLSACKLDDLSFLTPLTELKTVILYDNKLQDLQPLVEMAKSDEERRFAPFWRIYLRGNPLGDKAEEQMATLKELGGRIVLD